MRQLATYAFVFALIGTSAEAQRDHGPPPSALAQKCGSQIAWEPTLEAAIKKAQQTRKPIFWYLATVPRSPMDRKPVIDMYMRAGPFSMPDVVAAINAGFVPLKAYPSRDEAKGLHLGPLEFIEPGFIVLKPDATEIGRVDRITTFHELWFVDVLNKFLEKPAETALPSDPCELGRLKARLGDAKAAKEALESAKTPEAQVELGLLALRQEDWAGAEAILAKVSEGSRKEEAQYLLGVARHRQNRQSEAIDGWQKLAAAAPESPWAAKAAAEAEHWGPFSRGFEEYGYLPKDAVPAKVKSITGSQRAREPKDADWLVQRSVRYLLERQNPDGGFDDSNYDFGGRDSLPDVYVAVTALCGLALLEWSAIDPERTRAAVARAAAYLSDESHVATENLQERVWAHSYRALFFARLARSGGPLAEQAAAKLKDVAKRLADLQAQNGRFGHEYPNPFASATALHALKICEKAGVPMPASVFKSGADALKGTRGADGTFSYGYERNPGSKDVDMAGGRMPTCELALLLCGESSEEKLAAALKTSVEHHDALEQVRKYDDHAPPHRIGGFFFWYDVYGRCLAIDALSDAAKKRALFDHERKVIVGIAEIDGRFVDSHELGKPYGTAMGLLSLKLCAPAGP